MVSLVRKAKTSEFIWTQKNIHEVQKYEKESSYHRCPLCVPTLSWSDHSRPLFHALLAGMLLALLPASVLGQSAVNTVTWRAHPPTSHGFDAAALADAVSRADEMAPPLTSLIVARGSTTVAEVYFDGMQPTDGANLKSASKSVLSALTGIAIANGTLDGLDQPIGPIFPDLLADAPRKQNITVRNLLTQQAGLESTSFGNYGEWVSSPNWTADALRRPMVDTRGGEMIYSTGNTHILAALLTRATGRPLRAYAQEHLFDPLGTHIRSWQRAPEGVYFGGNNMALTPRGMLRFGQLYLNRGRFGEQQVLPPAWIDLSWRTYVRSTYHGHQYGYLWFTYTFGGEEVAFAWGYGGQYIFVVPRLNLVVVCTSALQDRTRGSDDHNEEILRLLEQHIIPAARAPGSAFVRSGASGPDGALSTAPGGVVFEGGRLGASTRKRQRIGGE